MNGDWKHKKAEEEEEADMAGQRRGKEEELAIFISAVVQSVRDARAREAMAISAKMASLKACLSLSFCAHGDEREGTQSPRS